MTSVDLIVTEVDRLKNIIACLKGENAALKAELAQQHLTKVKTPKTPPVGEICSDAICDYCKECISGECESQIGCDEAKGFRGRKLLLT